MTTLQRLLVTLACASLASAPASASIPPSGWEGPQWIGPGLLCRDSFTLSLNEGERAEQQYPSVGLIRFLVRSELGVFEVAEDWYHRSYEGRELLRESEQGSVYRLTGRNEGRTYLFVPGEGQLPFLLRFDPLTSHPPSFTGAAEGAVLERLAFARDGRASCLEAEQPTTEDSTSR